MENQKWKLGRLFQASAQIYRIHFNTMIIICLTVYLPVYIIYQFIPITSRLSASGGELSIENINDFLVQAYLIMGVYILFTPLSAAAVAYLTKQHLLKETATLTGLLDASLMKWPKLAITSLFFLVVLSVASCLPVITIYLGVACGFYANIIATTDSWGFDSMWKSRHIVKGRWWRTGLIFLGIAAVYMIFNQIFAAFLSLFNPGAVLHVILSVISEIPLSFFTVFLAMYFFSMWGIQNENPPEDNISPVE